MDAEPQHKDCKPPATLGSSDSLVLCTTIPSATTSENAMQPLLTTNDAIVACRSDIGLSIPVDVSKKPPKFVPSPA